VFDHPEKVLVVSGGRYSLWIQIQQTLVDVRAVGISFFDQQIEAPILKRMFEGGLTFPEEVGIEIGRASCRERV